MAEALYRKYRPQIFEDVVGQEHIERTLKNAIAQDKVSHAYLFTGPRGTGKTTTARLLAKALLCQQGPTTEPDGTCEDCVMIANGEHPDVYELDAASRTGVENVREEIIGRVQFAPTRGRYKIYIIDEVHMLSTAAFNALLKTLEEPPDHVVMILATTDPQKVPETIHSRCQRFDFRRISAEAIVSRLGAICVSEDVEFEGEALDLIAHRAEGGMRNALTSLEQLIAFGDGKVTLEAAERLLGSIDTNDMAEIVRFVGERDVASCFRWTAEYVETGADLAQFTRDFAEHVRNLYIMSLVGADVALEVGEAECRELADELPLFGPDRLARLLGVLGDLSAELKTSTNPRLSFEIALTRMVRPESDLTLEALAERVEDLENNPRMKPVAAPAPSVAQSDRDAAQSGEPTTPTTPAHSAQQTEPAKPTSPAAQARPATPDVQAKPTPPAVQAKPVTAEEQGKPAEQSRPAEQNNPAEQSNREQSVPAASCAPQGISEQLASNLKNPAFLQRMWQSALTMLKRDKPLYGVLFIDTKAIYNEDEASLSIQFSASNTFTFNEVQKPDIRKAVAAALEQAAGEPISFEYTQEAAHDFDEAVEPQVPSAYVAPTSDQNIPDAAEQPESGASPLPTVPADVDVPPYEDEVVPYDDEPMPDDDAIAEAPECVPEDSASGSLDMDESDEINGADDIQTVLEAGFGDGVIVEEVRE